MWPSRLGNRSSTLSTHGGGHAGRSKELVFAARDSKITLAKQ